MPEDSAADALRRAYVAQLKAIDVDADPAAFMRLREAFEAALAGAAPTERATAERSNRYVAPPAETVVPDRAIVAPYGALSEASATFAALLDAGQTREAAALLEGMLAQGIIPLGGEDAFVRRLTACALADAALSTDELTAIATTFHADQTAERADALRWRAGIEADAARGRGIRGMWARFGHARTRVARALLAAMVKHELFSGDLPALRVEVSLAARYARWFPDFVDAIKAEKELRRLERSLRGQELLAVIVFAVIVAMLGLAHGWEWAK